VLLYLVGSGAHPASYPLGTGGTFPGRGRKGDHPPPSSVRSGKLGSIHPLPHMSLQRGT
jgi:hypothetical protein